MKSISKFLALVAVSAVSSAASAGVIDNFSDFSSLTQTGPGSVSQTTNPAGGALGGQRFQSVTVQTGGASANANLNIDANGSSIGVLNSQSGVNALFGITYGAAADLNANFSLTNQDAFTIRLLKSDIGSTNNTIIVTTAGIGSASASYTLPSLVGLGGPPTPFDVTVPFASFSGAAVDFSNIDRIAYSFNTLDSADWQIQLLGTATAVPTPSAAIGGLVLLVGLSLVRSRRMARA